MGNRTARPSPKLLGRGAAALIATAAGTAFIPLLWLALKPFVPEAPPDKDFLRRTFLLSVDLFRPERLERLTFLLSLALVPVVILLTLWGTRVAVRHAPARSLRLIWVAAACAIAFFFWRMPSNLLFFQEIFPVARRPILRTVAALAIPAALLFGALFMERRLKRAGVIASWMAFSFAALGSFLFIISDNAEISPNFPGGIHLDAVIYSVAQTVRGRAMLIDTVNQYGLYPQFLEPAFHVIGLTIFRFTLVMWLLMIASFGALFAFLRRNLRNVWLQSAAMLSIAYFSYFSTKGWFPDEPYFQYHPLRFLFPCLALNFFDRYLRHPGTILFYFCAAGSATAVLFNPDSGVVVFGTWIALLVFREFASQAFGSAIRSSAVAVVRSLGALAAVLGAEVVYCLVRYHAVPDFRALGVDIPVFYTYGGAMLPLPPHHPWMLVIVVYAFGAARALESLLAGENSRRAQILVMVSVLGIGLFAYYQGRSHDNNLLMVMYPAVILVAIFTDESLTLRSRYGGAWWWNVSYAGLAFLCLPLVLLPDYAQNIEPFLSRKLTAIRENRRGPLVRDAAFISRQIGSDKTAVILSNRAGVEHVLTGTSSAVSGAGLTEMLWRWQADKQASQLDQLRDVPVFLDVRAAVPMPFLQALADQWRWTADDFEDTGFFAAFERAEQNEPADAAGWHLRDDGSPAVHVRTGRSGLLIDNRRRAVGAVLVPGSALTEARELTIEVLANPQPAQPPWATIVSTHPGRLNFRGFVIHHVPTGDNAFAAAIGNGQAWINSPDILLVPNLRVYLCLVIARDHGEIYLDGSPAAHFSIPGGLSPSDLPVAVGNWQSLTRPFHGIVEEVYIRQRAISAAEIRHRWDELAKAGACCR